MSRKKLLISVLLVVAMVVVLAGCDTTKEYTLTIKQEGEGTVTPKVGTHKYKEKTTVNLTVKPAEGWEFSEWKGDAVAKVNVDKGEYKIAMTGNKSITAVFVKEGEEPDPFKPTEEPPVVEGEAIHDIDKYALEIDPYGSNLVEDGIKLVEIGTSEVLYVNAAEGNTVAKVDPIKDFSGYSSITFYVCADSEVQIDPIAQNSEFDFFKANTVTVSGDGQWHKVSFDPVTYGDAYSNPEDAVLDLTDIKKIAFEIKNDVDFYMTNPVGVLKEDEEDPDPDPEPIEPSIFEDFESYEIGDTIAYMSWYPENAEAVVTEDPLVEGNQVLKFTAKNYNAVPVIELTLPEDTTLADYTTFTFKGYFAEGDVGWKTIYVAVFTEEPSGGFQDDNEAIIGSLNRDQGSSSNWEDINIDIEGSEDITGHIYVAFGMSTSGSDGEGDVWYADDVTFK